MQSSQRDVLSEIKSLKKDLHTLHSDHKALQEAIKNNDRQFNIEDSQYKVDRSHIIHTCIRILKILSTQNELWTKVAKAYCRSLTREVGESSIKVDD